MKVLIIGEFLGWLFAIIRKAGVSVCSLNKIVLDNSPYDTPKCNIKVLVAY